CERPPREPIQPRPNLVRQRRRTAHVEAQLHGRGKLVDVLPARAGRTDEAFRDLAIVDRDVVVDADHGAGSWANLRVLYNEMPGDEGGQNSDDHDARYPVRQERRVAEELLPGLF